MYRPNNTDIFFDDLRGKMSAHSDGKLFVPDSTFLINLVQECWHTDWGHVRNAEKIVSKASGVSIGTIRGIKKGEHGVSLATVFALAPHMPTLRRRLAELLGYGPSASVEAKTLQLLKRVINGEHDETIQKLYSVPVHEIQTELCLH